MKTLIGGLMTARDGSSRVQRGTVLRFPFTGSDKLIYAMDGVSKYMLHCIMELQGSLNRQHLANAIDFALEKSPVLKSIARLRDFAAYWEVVHDLAPYPILTVKDLSTELDVERAARDVIEGYINDHIDITQTPPARFFLIRVSEERSMFIVKVHHCALDPMGLFHLIEDVQDAYGKLFRGESLPPVGEMADRSRKKLFRNVSPILFCRAITKAVLKSVRSTGSARRCFVQFSNPSPTDTIAYHSLVFRGRDYAALHSRCKSLGVTANELLMAALCRAIRQWNGRSERTDGAYSIVMPVDLRRYVRQGGKIPRIMASFIGGSLVTIPVAVVTTFEATVEYVTRQTRFIKDYHLGLLANLGFPLLYLIPPRRLRQLARRHYERDPGKSVPTAVFAYLGKIDRALSSFPECPIIGIEGVGTSFYPVGLDVVVNIYERMQTVTVTYPKDACSEAEMTQFMALFSEEILPKRLDPIELNIGARRA